MCFFVGNDFLPHLPSLEIREGAIDRLVRIYKETIRQTGGYLATAGEVNLSRVQVVLRALGEAEDQIFKNRREDEVCFIVYIISDWLLSLLCCDWLLSLLICDWLLSLLCSVRIGCLHCSVLIGCFYCSVLISCFYCSVLIGCLHCSVLIG